MTTYKTFIGIDVSKESLEVCVVLENETEKEHCEIANTKRAIVSLARYIAKYDTPLVVLEATGNYDAETVEVFHEREIATAVVNPRWIRDFARSMGRLAKTDSIDAHTIALYGKRMEPKPTKPQSPLHKRLKALSARRRQLIALKTMENGHGEHVRDRSVGQSVERIEKLLLAEIKEIDSEIQRLFDDDEDLKRKMEVMTSVPGVGKVTAAAVLSECPEIGECTKKQIASLAGLAPVNRDSGKWRGRRMIGGGRQYLRKALYMSAVVASRHHPILSCHYQRLIESGKPFKVAVTAVMRRLLVILNALIKTNACWDKNHVGSATAKN